MSLPDVTTDQATTTARVVGILDAVDRAHSVQERRQVAESYDVGPQATYGQMVVDRGLVADGGLGGWELTAKGAELLHAERDRRTSLRSATAHLDDAEGERDRLIVAARGAGYSLRQIAEWTGLTHQTVANIEQRQRDAS